MRENKTLWLWIGLIAVLLVGFFIYQNNSQPVVNDTTVDLFSTSTSGQPAVPVASSSSVTNTTMQDNPIVVFDTTKGKIEVELFRDKAPKTVANFLKLTESGFYNGTLFHRVIKGFMIQGGDPLTKSDPTNIAIHGTGGPGYTFADEINNVKLTAGILAMANAGPNTNGSQFFIVTAAATPWLDGHHTAFGRVVSGMDVVSAIENVPTGQNDRPGQEVKVNSISVK